MAGSDQQQLTIGTMQQLAKDFTSNSTKCHDGAPWHCPNPACGREVLPGWTTCPACHQELDAPVRPAPKPQPRRFGGKQAQLAGVAALLVAAVAFAVLLPATQPLVDPQPVWSAIGDTRPVAFGEPVGVAFGRDGRIFVSQNGLHRVTVLAADGSELASWGGLGNEPGKLHNPAGLAVDASGTLYVADARNNRIQKFAPDGHRRAR